MQLPDEIVDVLVQLASDLDKCSWKLGDMTADLVEELHPLYSKSEVRKSIANSCGLSIETVRDREWVARHVTQDKRHYNLSFHQYKACLGAGSEWELLAQRAVEEADDWNGKPAPVSVIRSWLKSSGYEWEKAWERVLSLCTKLAEDADTPEAIVHICGVVLDYEEGRE